MKTFFKILFKILIGILAFIGFLTVSLIALVIMLPPDFPYKADYCIEDGDCEAHRVVVSEGREITISKETCIEEGWRWSTKGNYCKIEPFNWGVQIKK